MPQVLSLCGPPVPGASLRRWPTNHRVGRPRLSSDRLRSQPASVELPSTATCKATCAISRPSSDSQEALSYLRQRLARRRLHAETFEAETSDFCLRRSADAAYCLINTFRHLLTEQAAHDHLECIVENLRPGGIYVLGMDLLPLHIQRREAERWTRRRRKTNVTVTHRVLNTDLHHRIENVRVCILRSSRVERTAPAARISVADVHAETISAAAHFGSVAGTVRHL
jgi:hypothetical protein